MIKVDLHLHSNLSKDSAISDRDIKDALSNNVLDKIAITDHDEVDRAMELQSELGDQIIVGEEIKSKEGHVIGLYLRERIVPGLKIEDTISEIKSQGGVVYLPHIYDSWRHGVGEEVALRVLPLTDIIEVFNSRARKSNNTSSLAFAKQHGKLMSCATDSHNRSNIGKAYTILDEFDDKAGLLNSLENPDFKQEYAPFSLMTPTFNKMRSKLTNG